MDNDVKEQHSTIPCEKCIWTPCDNRVHNKGNGAGKYRWYECAACGKHQKRAVKSGSKGGKKQT